MIEHFLTYGDNLEDQSVASNASSAPLDHCGDYNDWLAAGCPDSDTEYLPDSEAGLFGAANVVEP